MSEPLILISALIVAALVAVVLLANTMLPPAPAANLANLPNVRLSGQLQKYAAEMSFRFDNPTANEQALHAAVISAWGGDYTSSKEIVQFRQGELVRLRDQLEKAYKNIEAPVITAKAPSTTLTPSEQLPTVPDTTRPEASEVQF